MGMLIVQHRVKDYRKWRRAYDAHAPARRKAGLGSSQVYRGADDPRQVAVVLKVKNADKVKTFIESDDLRKAMKAAGVIGKPTITFMAAGPQRVTYPGIPVGAGKRPRHDKPPEVSADAWARFQQALDTLQESSTRSGKIPKS